VRVSPARHIHHNRVAGAEAQTGSADEIVHAGVNQRAFGVEPYLAAQFAPQTAKTEILAQIFPRLGIDYAFEQGMARGEPVPTEKDRPRRRTMVKAVSAASPTAERRSSS
jgi:hypothetical protein